VPCTGQSATKEEEETEINYTRQASLTALASAVTPKWAKLVKPEVVLGRAA
jgi:hypothetical protein